MRQFYATTLVNSIKMNLAKEAFDELFPRFSEERKLVVSYSGKFKDFNANVKYSDKFIHFSLSKGWLEFGDDLKKGVIQHLLLKMFSCRKFTKPFSLDLYEKFIDNVGRYSKVDRSHPELDDSFERINKRYFNDMMEKPNLVWGLNAFRKLGHYEFASNTVVMSSIFRGEPEMIDYIMHHELLHKKHGGKTTKSGRTIHHSREFKLDEAKYHDKESERKLKRFLRKKKLKNVFKIF